ncbi:MAG: hypothetical protein ACFUZC_19865 [Chthoniobacteraceae bacterium]
MKKRLARISPLQLGIVLAVLYGLLSLIVFVPMGLLFAGRHTMGSVSSAPTAFPFSGLFLLGMPVLYAIMGFISGVIGAAVYNLVAKFTGGIEVTVTDAPEA